MAGKEETASAEHNGNDDAIGIANAIHDLADAIRTYARAISSDDTADEQEEGETYLDGTKK